MACNAPIRASRVTVVLNAVEIIPRASRSRPTGSTKCGCGPSSPTPNPHFRGISRSLCDGNRRWARDAGYCDVSYGYRMGAAKIAEMLRWCARARASRWRRCTCSTENLQRDPEELAALIEIITDVVEEICAPANLWSVRIVGDLGLLGDEPARRLREAVDGATASAPPGSFHVNVAVGYGGRQEIVDAVRSLLSKQSGGGPCRGR